MLYFYPIALSQDLKLALGKQPDANVMRLLVLLRFKELTFAHHHPNEVERNRLLVLLYDEIENRPKTGTVAFFKTVRCLHFCSVCHFYLFVYLQHSYFFQSFLAFSYLLELKLTHWILPCRQAGC